MCKYDIKVDFLEIYVRGINSNVIRPRGYFGEIPLSLWYLNAAVIYYY